MVVATPSLTGTAHTAVSVVIPCYNAARFLPEALHSAVTQTHPPLEVLVIDDGSTDASAQVAENFGAPVRVLRQANQGEAVARNRGFDEASGEWIAFLDADDVWHPTKLERQVALMSDNVVCVHSAYYEFGASRGRNDKSGISAERRYRVEFMSWNPFVSASSAVVRKDVKARFPTWTKYGEDHIFFLDLLQEGEFQQVDAFLTGHRRHSRNQTAVSGVEARWHQTMLKWLAMHENRLGPATVERIRAGWRHRLARAALRAMLHGRVAEARFYFRYLKDVETVLSPLAGYLLHAGARMLYRLTVRPIQVWTNAFAGTHQ